ncbi:6793_t:CDS:2 [Dentiscutata erythropus]|uniref:6793_t:CDS:1 n=1 Tax=Dentiscutata erythropus TaxID=1348616 RepID=A0A9N9HPX6_9GLOM|nr:6793_t:CDS:2 [Dentiscutata erythropus]
MDCDDGFFEDQLDRPQTSLCSLLVDIQLSDIVEVWELFGITKSYKHYIMMTSKNAKFNIGLIAKKWYLEDIQDQDGQLKLQETIEVKKALNLALDLNCEDEFLDIISNFITRKKSSIQSTSNEKNLCVLDPLVQKRHGRRPNKRIKSATEKSYHSSSGNSAINPPDPNLISRKKANQDNSNNGLLNVSDYEDTNVRTQPMQQRYAFRNPLHTLNSNDIHIQEKTDFNDTDEVGDDVSNSDKSFIVDENIIKCKYIYKACGKSGHNINFKSEN